MPERWRSSAARDLVAAVREAKGTVERAGKGRLRIIGPDGEITIQEPRGETRRDLRRSSAAGRITGATGLKLGDATKFSPHCETCKCGQKDIEARWDDAVDWLLNSRYTGDPDIQRAFWGIVDGKFSRDHADKM